MAKKKATKKKTRRAAAPTAERRIMFYRIDCGTDEGGDPVAYAPEPPLRRINGLDWNNNGRYQLSMDGGVLCAWIDRMQANQHMQFATVRRAGLPLVEDGSGTLTSLGIPASSGLAEITHVVFFSNNILGTVFNFYGPRPTKLSGYLKAKVPSTPAELSIQPLIRADVAEQLERFETLRLVDLKIRPSYARIVSQANDSLGSAFTAATAAVTGGAKGVQLVLTSDRKKTANLGPALMAAVKWLAGRDDLHENVARFTVGGLDSETGNIAKLDLLSDKLVMAKKIVRQSARSRALDNNSAYTAIQEAYNELSDELEAASSMEI